MAGNLGLAGRVAKTFVVNKQLREGKSFAAALREGHTTRRTVLKGEQEIEGYDFVKRHGRLEPVAMHAARPAIILEDGTVVYDIQLTHKSEGIARGIIAATLDLFSDNATHVQKGAKHLESVKSEKLYDIYGNTYKPLTDTNVLFELFGDMSESYLKDVFILRANERRLNG